MAKTAQVSILDIAGASDSSLAAVKKVLASQFGFSLPYLSSMYGPSLEVVNQLRSMDAAIRGSQFVGTMAQIARQHEYFNSLSREFRLFDIPDVAAIYKAIGMTEEAFIPYTSRYEMIPNAVRNQVEQISGFNQYLRSSPDLSAAFELPGVGRLASAWDAIEPYERALTGLPDWLRPVSQLQAMQLSWEIAAQLGVAGIGTPSLVHDVVNTIYADRPETTGFEAVVQMLQIADETEDEFAGRVLEILRTYTAASLEALHQTKDWIKQQGLLAVLGFLVALVSLYESHLSRVATEEQLDLAQQSQNSAPEITKHQDELKQAMDQILKQKTEHEDARVLSRATALRAKPEEHGMVIRELYPDDHVRVLEEKDGWAYVEAYQFHSEQTQHGWLDRRTLNLPQR